MDGYLLFDNAAPLTTSAGSTNILDLQNFRDLGVGSTVLNGFVLVSTAFASTGSSTLVAAVQGSTDGTTWTTMLSLPSVAKAALVAGARIDFKVPRPVPGQALPRYLRMNYTVGVADFTSGNLTAALVLDRQDTVAYPAGLNVAN